LSHALFVLTLTAIAGALLLGLGAIRWVKRVRLSVSLPMLVRVFGLLILGMLPFGELFLILALLAVLMRWDEDKRSFVIQTQISCGITHELLDFCRFHFWGDHFFFTPQHLLFFVFFGQLHHCFLGFYAFSKKQHLSTLILLTLGFAISGGPLARSVRLRALCHAKSSSVSSHHENQKTFC